MSPVVFVNLVEAAKYFDEKIRQTDVYRDWLWSLQPAFFLVDFPLSCFSARALRNVLGHVYRYPENLFQ